MEQRVNHTYRKKRRVQPMEGIYPSDQTGNLRKNKIPRTRRMIINLALIPIHVNCCKKLNLFFTIFERMLCVVAWRFSTEFFSCVQKEPKANKKKCVLETFMRSIGIPSGFPPPPLPFHWRHLFSPNCCSRWPPRCVE